MGEDFSLLPKGTGIIKLPRRSPLMLRVIMLTAVMMCGIYLSSTGLKQTMFRMKLESVRAKPIEQHPYSSRLVGLMRTEIQFKPELSRAKPIEEHSYYPGIVAFKQPVAKTRLESMRTNPMEERAYDPRIVSLKQTNTTIKSELPMSKLVKGHSYNPRVVSLDQSMTETRPELMNTKQKEKHPHDSGLVGLKQSDTGQVIMSTDGISQQASDSRIIDLQETKIKIKSESAAIKLVEQHPYVPKIAGSSQMKIQIKPELERTKPPDQHPYDPRIINLNQTNVQEKTELLRTNLTQPHCQDPGIPQSEIPYVHYPVPTNYSRRECACIPVRFYVIISMQRSGSKWLESLLNSHVNVSSNGEIFIDRRRSANVSALTRTLDKVYNLDERDSISRKGCTAAVGFKWMLNQGIMQNQQEVFRYFKRRAVSVIFLFRRNLLRRMISLLANSQDHKQLNGTHKAHVHSQQEAEILAIYKPKLNAKLLVSKLKHASARASNAVENFKSIRHMVLYYEDLVQNTTQKLTEVMEFLRVPQRRLRSRHVKIHTRPVSEMVRNWNAVRRALKGSQFESFLTSE